jgi:NADPH:quinone reductase-like Zn-dependent oxidoreductase
MKAIVCEKYGSPDDLELNEIDLPTFADDQMLVRVHAASANPVDWHRMRGKPYLLRAIEGLTKRKNSGLGSDLAGRVEAVGGNVHRFQPGDEVFGMGRGTFAEYALADEDGIVHKPANLTFEQAAAVPVAALTALQGLRDKGGIQPGHKVLINGAAGGVGTFAVQIAKSFGAEVTGICSTRNVDMVKSIGADRVVDYTREDFTKTDERYDVMLDTVSTCSLLTARRLLKPDGVYVGVGAVEFGNWIGPLLGLVALLVVSRVGSRKLVTFMANGNEKDLLFLKELLETGKVTPVIDRQYPLSEVPEALGYLEEGHAQGKVVITV